VYPVIVDPPSSAGACHDTTTLPSPSGVAVKLSGTDAVYATLGVPTPVEAADKPTEFTATNNTVYEVPSVNPDTVAVDAVAPTTTGAVGVLPAVVDVVDVVAVSEYPVTGDPPS
jgi:hypothetical protein